MYSPRMLVLGTAQLGLPYGLANKTGQPDQKMATAIIREAWNNGIREFDTAQGYGESETALGRALSELGVSQEAQIITKFHPDLDHPNATALSNSVDKSLEKLGVPSLFGILVHREEMLSVWEKGLGEILHDIESSGRVKHIGVSVYSPDKALQALNIDGIDMLQVPTNILDRRFEKSGVFQLAIEKRKTIYVRSVFLQGLILMDLNEVPEKMAFAKPVLEKLESLSKDLGLTRHEMALGYLRSEMPSAHVIFGAETQNQVKENAMTWQREMPQSLSNHVKRTFADVSKQILNPVVWCH